MASPRKEPTKKKTLRSFINKIKRTMSISTEAYTERNLKGFEGDNYMRDEFESLIEAHHIKTIIETGTFKGGTTNQLRKMADKVYTIEISEQYFKEAETNIQDHSNVIMINGSSPETIDWIFTNEIPKAPLFFFLDAHWGNVCPLLMELRMIAKHHLKPVIAIHDFYVPGKDFGYDSYNGRKFDFEFIRKDIEFIYGVDGFTYHYNDQAEGAKRGIIYIEPK